MWKRLLVYSKVAIPLLLGICIGIALSFIILPLVEEQDCEWNLRHSTHRDKNQDYEHKKLMTGIDWESFKRSEYEPHLIKSQQSEPLAAKKPVRHRFIRSEVDIKETLFIGYLATAAETDKRVSALNRTISWPQENNQALKFFIDTSSRPDLRKNSHTSSLISLNLLEARTLPLLAIKYMAINTKTHNQYKYYMFVPDTVYVITTALATYLQQLQHEQFIGFASTSDAAKCDLSRGFIVSQVRFSVFLYK